MIAARGSAADGVAAHLAGRGIEPDAAQRAAIAHLEDLRGRLIAAEARAASPVARVRKALLGSAPGIERGVYLYGGVGRGKTLLMDAFIASLPFDAKRRTHFHRFMHDAHARLGALPGVADPLERVADEWAATARVIALDELFVSDIADAMILAGLFDALISRGVALVITSNARPAELYRDGLQRARFLPAIALLEANTELVAVDGEVDYRLRALADTPLYLDAADSATPATLQRLFALFAGAEGHGGAASQAPRSIEIAGRTVPVVRESDNAVWFEFRALCDGPRSQEDYIEIARDYPAVVLSGVPAMDDTTNDAARRFIALIDELHDRSVNVAIAAAAPPATLYRGSRLAFEFARTSSRLIEMQGEAWLARAHHG